ncbi:hypothetical protein [uncultured Brevundimonas sp.]|uniref:hypothetical protein n=1 Tax=uncultured Brevundimonas sp. TaxID=213418 RepID=UPI002591D548|nr:hypothetical protein [uncultured Brevundimonas sp.]
MELRIVIMAMLVAGAGACSGEDEAAPQASEAPAGSAWIQPPRIDALAADGTDRLVRGAAGPGARVVLRGADGEAVAAAADSKGRFELRIPAPSAPVLLTPEVQLGEDASVSPDRLVLIPGGPAALIAAGEATRRLDAAGPLDAIDSDGAALQIVGRASPQGAPPTVVVDGAPEAVTRLSDGRWRVLVSGGGARSIVVGGRTYAYPGVGAPEGTTLARAGDGWRIGWPTPPQGRQESWLPD